MWKFFRSRDRLITDPTLTHFLPFLSFYRKSFRHSVTRIGTKMWSTVITACWSRTLKWIEPFSPPSKLRQDLDSSSIWSKPTKSAPSYSKVRIGEGDSLDGQLVIGYGKNIGDWPRWVERWRYRWFLVSSIHDYGEMLWVNEIDINACWIVRKYDTLDDN